MSHSPAQTSPPPEYESGRVICHHCGDAVPIRDDANDFTTNHWEAHRKSCPAAALPSDTVIYTPESTAEALSHPPAKRRRAKRTEEERIQYLRADPYVAQFEAYRVLCASCHKWIRLRPNSTYCSIPWDAHRKSCLAKKVSVIKPLFFFTIYIYLFIYLAQEQQKRLRPGRTQQSVWKRPRCPQI